MVAAQSEHGIVLRDPQAAMDCPCGCHPRLDLGAHGGAGQVGCSCQQTPEEREAAVQQLFASLAAARPQPAGTVDGRGFYLRERHGLWRVMIAPDEDPGIDPWTADPSVPTLDIADGDADRLLADGDSSVVRALDVAVGAVRSFLRQRTCGHGRALPGDRFCPACGTALAAPELP